MGVSEVARRYNRDAELAVHGGTPVREEMLPYGRQSLDEDDIKAVVAILRSNWLTTGPSVSRFEREFASCVGVAEAVALANGTAALHAAIYAAGIEPGDEVITSPLTFVASANCVVFQGGTPVFADVDPCTLTLDPERVKAKVTPRTKAIVAVDYGGHPCDYDGLREIAEEHGLTLIADACHALGGSYRGSSVGSLADLNVFSFHPVKTITTGEGGMVTTDKPDAAARVRLFRNHGISSDHSKRAKAGTWEYEMVDLGYNYRITDFQCILGCQQLRKLPRFVARRREIAQTYDAAFTNMRGMRRPVVRDDVEHAYHIYPILLDHEFSPKRKEVFEALRAEGIGANVHYIPVHLHPYYRARFGTQPGESPEAEGAYERLLSLPVFPGMTDRDADDVICAVRKVIAWYSR